MATLIEKARAALTGDDAERLARRREIKRQVADLESLKARQTAIVSQIRLLSERENRAVAQHETTTAPIQLELLDIDRAVSDAIMADHEVADDLVARRTKAIDKLTTANQKLEVEVEALGKLRAELQRQRQALEHRVGEIGKIRAQLAGRDLANPRLQIERHVLGQALVAAEKRQRDARREFTLAQEDLDKFIKRRAEAREKKLNGELLPEAHPEEWDSDQDRLTWERDLAQAELEAAEQARADAVAARERLRDEILNE